MRTTINVRQIELRQSKAGKDYYSIKTNQGAISCFDKKNIEKLKIGEDKDVEIVENNGFKNLRSVYDNKLSPAEGIVDLRKQDKYEDARKAKDVSMYTSYAKDIFVALWKDGGDIEDVMYTAVDLVKQAKEEFEDKGIPEEAEAMEIK